MFKFMHEDCEIKNRLFERYCSFAMVHEIAWKPFIYHGCTKFLMQVVKRFWHAANSLDKKCCLC